MSIKEKLIETFGICSIRQMCSIDEYRLFAKSGITVIAALAGQGKTTKMLEYAAMWENKGYQISYMNFDSAPTYGAEMIECPTSQNDVDKMMRLIELHARDNDIIILDSLKSLASYCEYNVEYNDEMYSLMLELRTIIKKTSCSVILVHHVYRPKNIKTHVDSFYGARAIEEQCDSGFMYTIDEIEIVKSRLGHARGTKLKV